jgi:hypothetical protein
MKRTAITAALIVAAYTAGTMAPRAQAADSLSSVVEELKGIRRALESIQRRYEDKAR